MAPRFVKVPALGGEDDEGAAKGLLKKDRQGCSRVGAAEHSRADLRATGAKAILTESLRAVNSERERGATRPKLVVFSLQLARTAHQSCDRAAGIMNDLLDLDLSAPAPASTAQSKPGGAQAAYGAGRSTFDYLSSMRTTTTSPLPSRSASPYSAPPPSLGTSSNATNGRLAPAAAGRPAAPAKAGSGAGDDAFSSLFGGSPSSSQAAASGGGLSMAERLAKDSAAKVGGLGAGSWSGLSPNNTGGSGSRSP